MYLLGQFHSMQLIFRWPPLPLPFPPLSVDTLLSCLGSVTDWMFPFPQNAYVRALPQCDGIRRWGLWERIRFQWGHECGATMTGLVSLWEETPTLPLSAMWGYSEKAGICKPGRGSSPRTASILILDFPASRTRRNKCLLFKPPIVWCFVNRHLSRLRQALKLHAELPPPLNLLLTFPPFSSGNLTSLLGGPPGGCSPHPAGFLRSTPGFSGSPTLSKIPIFLCPM